MIPTTCKEALRRIRTAEHEITFENASVLEESYRMASLLRNLLSEIKECVLENGFGNHSEEIEFFKNVKPQILGKLIYYNKVFRLESACPVGSGKMYRKYFSEELRHLQQEFREHIRSNDFYRYYRTGRTDWDHHFFQLGNVDLQDGVNSFVFEIDLQFSTHYDYKLAKIVANELLYDYLLSKCDPEKNGDFGPDGLRTSQEFVWTDSKNALIELIYALHASGSISHGKLGIRKISAAFQALFRVKLGDVHHAFHRMKDRTDSRSLFLDQLTSSLRQHMDKEL